MDEQAFKEAVWSVDRHNFRPGDALDAFERAKVKDADPATTQGAVEALEHVANWKEFYDRNVGAWDESQYGRLTIGSYARSVLASAAPPRKLASPEREET